MELEYELTIEDILHFNMYHVKHSKTMKRNLLAGRLTLPVLSLIIGIFFLITANDLITFFMLSIISIIWILFFKKYVLWKSKRITLKMIKEEKNKGMVGNQKLIITDTSITGINEFSKTEHHNKFLISITSDDMYYFLYLTSITAIIIPKKVFTPELSEKDFLEKVQVFVE